MCGTDAACATSYASAARCPVLTFPYAAVYALTTRCPVLTYGILLPGIFRIHPAFRLMAMATPPVLCPPTKCWLSNPYKPLATVLRMRYGLCGTDVGYAVTVTDIGCTSTGTEEGYAAAGTEAGYAAIPG
eukprot:2512125-Rhodomonas_salina.2